MVAAAAALSVAGAAVAQAPATPPSKATALADLRTKALLSEFLTSCRVRPGRETRAAGVLVSFLARLSPDYSPEEGAQAAAQGGAEATGLPCTDANVRAAADAWARFSFAALTARPGAEFTCAIWNADQTLIDARRAEALSGLPPEYREITAQFGRSLTPKTGCIPAGSPGDVGEFMSVVNDAGIREPYHRLYITTFEPPASKDAVYEVVPFGQNLSLLYEGKSALAKSRVIAKCARTDCAVAAGQNELVVADYRYVPKGEPEIARVVLDIDPTGTGPGKRFEGKARNARQYLVNEALGPLLAPSDTGRYRLVAYTKDGKETQYPWQPLKPFQKVYRWTFGSP